ncbi:MAG: hypothetical protein ABSH49_31855, partial [Bryobacteraceae bacterium]
ALTLRREEVEVMIGGFHVSGMLAMFPSVSPEIQQLVDAGVTARLGHSSIRTTQEIYAHMIHGQDDEAARKWEEYQLSNAPEKGSADA